LFTILLIITGRTFLVAHVSSNYFPIMVKKMADLQGLANTSNPSIPGKELKRIPPLPKEAKDMGIAKSGQYARPPTSIVHTRFWTSIDPFRHFCACNLDDVSGRGFSIPHP